MGFLISVVGVESLPNHLFTHTNAQHTTTEASFFKRPAKAKTDYEEKGRNELETFLKENAEIIKRHPQLPTSNLKAFPTVLVLP